MKKKTLLTLLVVLIIATLAGCVSKESIGQSSASQSDKTVTEDFTASETYIDFVAQKTKNHPEINVFFNESENTVYVQDNIYDIEHFAKFMTDAEKDQELKTWALFTETETALSKSDKKLFDNDGFDVYVVHQLVSDDDSKKILFECKDGVVVYDCANEISSIPEPTQPLAEEEQKKETTRRFDDKQFHGILYQIPIGWKEVLEDFDADIKFYQPTSDHWGQMEVVYQENPLVVGADDSTTILTTALIGNYSAKNFSGVKTQESNGINTIFAHVEFTDSVGEDFKGDCAVLNSDNGLISLFLMCEQDELLYDYTFPVVLEQIRIDQ